VSLFFYVCTALLGHCGQPCVRKGLKPRVIRCGFWGGSSSQGKEVQSAHGLLTTRAAVVRLTHVILCQAGGDTWDNVAQ
jgi:hypothetical protein